MRNAVQQYNLNPNEKTLTFTEALIAMKKAHMAWVLQ